MYVYTHKFNSGKLRLRSEVRVILQGLYVEYQLLSLIIVVIITLISYHNVLILTIIYIKYISVLTQLQLYSKTLLYRLRNINFYLKIPIVLTRYSSVTLLEARYMYITYEHGDCNK